MGGLLHLQVRYSGTFDQLVVVHPSYYFRAAFAAGSAGSDTSKIQPRRLREPG